MEAPKCKTCGQRHWSAVCTAPTAEGRFDPVAVQLPAARDADLIVATERLVKFDIDPRVYSTSLFAQSADEMLAHKRAKKAAQMRRYRAKAKVAK